MQEIKEQIGILEKEIKELSKLLKIEEKRPQVHKLQLRISEPEFWDGTEFSQVIIELKALKGNIDDWDNLNIQLRDLKELFSIQDKELLSEISSEAQKLKNGCERLRLEVLFSGKFDNANAIIEINSGAGGTEACDWAGMLFRMYFRWAEDRKFKFKVLNEVRGEEAGIKNITFFIEGLRAYGLLIPEKGVHRLVRISPFDANKRRHTSFASVSVLPEVKGDIEIDVQPEDLRIDTYRSSGAGGQHVNVTDSAVRITHLPTGIVVSSQNERSQHQNKQIAFKILKAKLYELKEKENKKELEEVSGTKRKIEWGSQIRSYVLHPYLMVKDHRTNIEEHDAWAVLDGRIDSFIYGYLNWQVNKKC
ncbi:MAG: peptide chain release factor 2 [Candidatus Omnitrophota bacterium]